MGKIINLFEYREEKKMNTINFIANIFLSFASMTPKKLQKLCYYAQAWSLALRHQPLFEEEFEAWVHGPVCVQLYNRFREYRWNEIAQRELDVEVDDEVMELIESVYETYGDLDGDELEALTHSEAPWQEKRKGLEAWEPSNEIITRGSMEVFYGKMYEENQGE